MIAVIADDITGGAEIAGIGLRYGLSVELSTKSDIPAPHTGLWVISTDTRSMNRDEAVRKTVYTVKNLRAAGIQEIFKKTDSVLRGYVVAELAAQLKGENKKQVILCPANPGSGRKMINGIYLINGIPLHQTGFSNDPDFPVTTSDVREILKIHSIDEPFITIVDAASEEDLQRAARLKNDETILAGSAAFFRAYLESLNHVPGTVPSRPEMKNVFYICGSAYDKSRQVVEKAASEGAKVIYLSPLPIAESDFPDRLTEFSVSLASLLNQGEKAILAVGSPVLKGKEAAEKIRDAISTVVLNVLSETGITEMVIEGGATASAIFGKLRFTRFVSVHEFAPGVVRMKIKEREDLYVTIKPGSYSFPEQVWNFNA